MIALATINDLTQLSTLFDQYLVFYKKPSNIEKAKSYLKQRLENNEAIVFLAFDESLTAIGFTLLYETFSSVRLGKIIILNDLYVNASITNSGVGEQLINKSIEYATEKNIDLIRLRTTKDNFIAQGLYDKMNFKQDQNFYTYDLILE